MEPLNKKPKSKINWKKLALLTIANSAIAATGVSSFGDLLGIAITQPETTAKAAAVGAVLGASNLLINVMKEKLGVDDADENATRQE